MEDVAQARRAEMKSIAITLENIGIRLGFSIHRQEKNYLWQENGETRYAFHILASALVERALAETPFPAEQTVFVIPGGRASLITYKTQRDPALAARLKNYRLVKYRHLRTLLERPTLTRETFAQQLASDPLEKSKAQIIMF